MRTVTIPWMLIPARIYAHLGRLKGERAFYSPFFGKGVYAYIYCHTDGYYLYGLGMSAIEIGNRLEHHYKGYFGKVDKYSVPSHSYREASGFYGEASSWTNNLTSEKRASIGRDLILNSYIGIGVVPEDVDNCESNQGYEQRIRDIEAILQHAFIRYRNPGAVFLEVIGCQRKDLSGTPAYQIKSVFSNSTVQRIIGSPICQRKLSPQLI